MSDFMHWVTHGVKSDRFEMEPRVAIGLIVFVVAVTVVVALYLMLVGRTAAQGRHIERLQADLSRLQRENEALQMKIAQESTVPRLMERAIALGLVPVEQVEFLRSADSR